MDEQREQPIQQQQQQQQRQQQAPQLEQHNVTTTFVNQSAARAAAQPQAQPHEEDAWWWEVENGDLILDLVPNVDATYGESENISNNNNNNNNVLTSHLAPWPKGADESADVSLLANNTNSNGECKAANAIADDSNDVTAARRSLLLAEKTPQASDVREMENNEATSRLLNSCDAPAPCNAAVREQTLEEFKEELRIKRLARQTAVQDLRDEIAMLRRQLAEEQELTRRLRRNDCVELSSVDMVDASASVVLMVDEEGAIGGTTAAGPDSDDEDPQSRGRHANIELANAQLALQMANAENLSLRTELGVVQKQVGTLKEVIACCKQMLNVKEEQCVQLKNKLDEIETAFGERELKIMSSNLRQEYERQLGNIRQLRQLYEERQRIALAEQENLQRLISIKRDELVAEQQKTKNFEEHNQTLMKEIESANNELATLREECNEHKFEKKALKEEMGTVNTLFSQMVMGFNGENNLDIDRLTMMLEENRGLLNDMAIKEGNCTDGATLPKLLFELVEQAALSGKSNEGNTGSATGTATTTTSEEAYEMERDVPDNAQRKKSIENEEGEEEIPIYATAELPTADKDIDHNNRESKTDEVTATTATATATVASSTGAHCARKHHRRSSGLNRMKLPATVGSTATESSTLKIHEPEVMSKVATTQEIIGNLPKVWKVLMELLSHHKIERVQFEEHGASEECYKSVETANGPKAELSVSKTYIKLKDLILEKKSLVKETNRLKTLNCHLEYRLNEQEKRLSAVSLELTKTWHLVGKMQRQHRQLHTQEQILRYQLQQKRRLLTELKDELEYCRRKWAAARAKNDESQEQWNDLRREFALRKLEHANNSAESGYSDSGQASDDEMAAAAATEATGGTTAFDTEIAATSIGVGGSCASGAGGVATACRRKRLKEMFEHTRKIKRMQSTSPGRAADDCAEIVLRWNSAPPTCGWRDGSEGANNENTNASGGPLDTLDLKTVGTYSRGAIPKNVVTRTRHRSRREDMEEGGATDATDEEVNSKGERAERIQRLEEQCKTLIQRVLETSDNRELLEVQLRSFQDEIAPVQYVVPLNEVFKKKRTERMTRASSVPVTGTLTPREEEYTRKRSERLGRLEEESRELLSRIKRTADRGHYLRCSLDRLRRGPSREGSFESNTEEECSKTEENQPKHEATVLEAEQHSAIIALTPSTNEVELPAEHVNPNPLTANEEAYTARRSARLQRLENESRELLNRLTRNNERGTHLGSALDALHEQHGAVELHESETTTSATRALPNISPSPAEPKVSIEQRLENIEQISSNRMERLRILEEEGKELLNRLTGTSARGTDMINRIAAREQNRQSSASKSTTPETPTTTTDQAPNEDDMECATGMEATPAVASLLPTPNNVACSSIVPEELEDHVTVTTTPSQIAAQKGAIPKQTRGGSSTSLVLNAAIRAQAANNKELKQSQKTDGESLEDMVRRLRETPFPEENNNFVNESGETVAEREANEVEQIEQVAIEDRDENKPDTSD